MLIIVSKKTFADTGGQDDVDEKQRTPEPKGIPPFYVGTVASLCEKYFTVDTIEMPVVHPPFILAGISVRW